MSTSTTSPRTSSARPSGGGQPPRGAASSPSPPPRVPGPQRFRLHVDGAARGNPGPAGAGVVLYSPDGRRLVRAARPLDSTTNNVAEYQALLFGLDLAVSHGVRVLDIRSDSELVVRQITGEYQVKAPHLKALHREAVGRLKGFEDWTIRHVPREENAGADEMANMAIVRGRQGLSDLVWDS